MNHKQHMLAVRLAFEHLQLKLEQCQHPCADSDTLIAKNDAAQFALNVSLERALNADERELLQALIDMTIEGELTTDEDRKLAFEISELI